MTWMPRTLLTGTLAAALFLGSPQDAQAQQSRETLPANPDTIQQADEPFPADTTQTSQTSTNEEENEQFRTTKTQIRFESGNKATLSDDSKTLDNEITRTSLKQQYKGLGSNDFQGSYTVINDAELTTDTDNIPVRQRVLGLIGTIQPEQDKGEKLDDGWTGSNIVVFNEGTPLDAPYIETGHKAKTTTPTSTLSGELTAGLNTQAYEGALPDETYVILEGTNKQEHRLLGQKFTSTTESLIGRWGANVVNDAATFQNIGLTLDYRETNSDNELIEDQEIYGGLFNNAGTKGGIISFHDEHVEDGVGLERAFTAYAQTDPSKTFGKAKIAFGADEDPTDKEEAISGPYGARAHAGTKILTKPQIFRPKLPHTSQNSTYTLEAEILKTKGDGGYTEVDVVPGYELDLNSWEVSAALGPSYRFDEHGTDPGIEAAFNVDYESEEFSIGFETQIDDRAMKPYIKATWTPNVAN